ncbi:9246_t:CDS:10, partial [Acaulospora morrowiae]
QAHKYFERTHSEWDIVDFLNDSNESEFQDLDLSQKIGIYLKSLEAIMDADKGQRENMVAWWRIYGSCIIQVYRASYEVGVGAGAIYRVVLRSRLKVDLALTPLGRGQSIGLSYDSQPDRKRAKEYDQKRGLVSRPSIHINNSTIAGNIQGTGIIEDTSRKIIEPALKRKKLSKNCLSEKDLVIDAENNPFFVSEHGKGSNTNRNEEDEEVLNEEIKLPTHTSKKTKTSVTSAPNTRPRNDSEKSFSSDVEPEDDEEIKFDFTDIEEELQRKPINEWKVGAINVSRRFRQYQIEVLGKAKTSGLKYDNIYEILALSSIMVFCWPCPYPMFTIQEWEEITVTNPYKIQESPLSQEILSSFREAYCNYFLGNDVFMNGGNSKLSRAVACAFNDLYNSVPDVAPPKMSEDEHCYMFLHPISRPLFAGSRKEYELILNRANTGSTKRPDLSCTVDRVPILNSEFKPVGCTPLQRKKDGLKVQLKARKSINQQLQRKGGPGEAVILLNMGDLMQSYFMDLKYDGLYCSWSFLTTKMVIDKASIPLADFSIRHLVALEERIGEIAKNFKYRKYRAGNTTSPEQISYT